MSIQVVRADGADTMEVANRGAGMSDEVRRQALLPFYSTEKIVEAHGGPLAVHGRTGGGTVVEVWLPQ